MQEWRMTKRRHSVGSLSGEPILPVAGKSNHCPKVALWRVPLSTCVIYLYFILIIYTIQLRPAVWLPSPDRSTLFFLGSNGPPIGGSIQLRGCYPDGHGLYASNSAGNSSLSKPLLLRYWMVIITALSHTLHTCKHSWTNPGRSNVGHGPNESPRSGDLSLHPKLSITIGHMILVGFDGQAWLTRSSKSRKGKRRPSGQAVLLWEISSPVPKPRCSCKFHDWGV